MAKEKKKKKTPILPSKWSLQLTSVRIHLCKNPNDFHIQPCSQQKFLIHNAWNSFEKRKRKKKITKTQTFFYSKITKFL